MATSGTTLFCTEGVVVDLQRVSPAPGIHPVKTRVMLSLGKMAVYGIAGGTLAPSTSTLTLGTLGTASAGASAGTAGPWISMNDVTAAAGDYIWLRTSANQGFP